MAESCHCEERSDEAIQLDRHGALRAPRDDKDEEPGNAGANPAGAAIFLKEAPIVIPRSEERFAQSEMIEASRRPESGMGRVFCLRSWRKSNVPVRQSGVGSASLPERTSWSCGV